MDERRWLATFITPRALGAENLGALGPGDDGAIVGIAADEDVVATVDVQIEGQHFENSWLDDATLARRLVRSAVSDLAAMAARPVGLLISIESPELPGRVGEEFWSAIDDEVQMLEAPLLGGNVAASGGGLSLTLTAIGAVPRGRALLRSGARPGDVLLVTGTPGAAAHQRKEIAAGSPDSTQGPWTTPPVRLAEARWLVDTGGATAGIDISDGLWLDLERLLTASGVTAAIDIGEGVTGGLSADEILAGGEDYEILVAAPPSVLERCREFQSRFEVELTVLGAVKEATGASPAGSIELSLNGLTLAPPAVGGWDPFSNR